MTALLDCLKALAARPDTLPQPLAFIAHPAWTEDEGVLAILRGMTPNAEVTGLGRNRSNDER